MEKTDLVKEMLSVERDALLESLKNLVVNIDEANQTGNWNLGIELSRARELIAAVETGPQWRSSDGC